ncbi:AbrB/MazE/SpoVT family DNA-binding domain-containing protein [Dactylosporangium sp. NPDC051541]|uniref:AbrB/MazE/SpoVT family DNA-binding domain-containing protein n=1 Tax=Dactylosporangium sp. NPDC051541 TaxID=3363977 RepID=UPI0037971431
MPSAAEPVVPTLDIARLDRSGRVSARSLLDQLGWRPGDRLRVDVIDGAILIWPASDGWPLVGARGDLALPVAVRQMCAIYTWDLVVLAAERVHDLLIVHPAATVARLLAGLHTRLTAGGHGR